MRASTLMLVLSTLLGGCETSLLDNPSFDRWCGEQLCDWTTEAGDIERVGSWHERDYAVSFVGTPTAISQLSTSAVPNSCIRVDMIADVEDRAQLALLVDFQDDGLEVVRKVIPSTDWDTTSFVIQTPRSYSKVRYRFEKTGEGRAVLAQVWVDLESGCSVQSTTP